MARFLFLAWVLLVGCDDTRDTLDGSPPGLDSGRADASGPGTDGGRTDGGGDDGGGPGPSNPICVLGCATPSDCVTASPAFDLDNYRCESGACVYTGCVDDDECRVTFANPDYVCRDPGTGFRSCLEGCATAADCGTTPAFDADNYRCDSGVCIYQGCNTDAECEASFFPNYGCFDVEPPTSPLPIPVGDRNCVQRCTSPADCATDSGAFTADNYACEAGVCRYRGCNDAAECEASFANPGYLCR